MGYPTNGMIWVWEKISDTERLFSSRFGTEKHIGSLSSLDQQLVSQLKLPWWDLQLQQLHIEKPIKNPRNPLSPATKTSFTSKVYLHISAKQQNLTFCSCSAQDLRPHPIDCPERASMTGALRGGFGSETSTTSTAEAEVVTDDGYSNRQKDQDQGFRDVSSILPYSTSFLTKNWLKLPLLPTKNWWFGNDLVYTWDTF